MNDQCMVYRVQDAHGEGPYGIGQTKLWADEDHEKRNPPVYDEFDMHNSALAMKNTLHYACGFRDLVQLFVWFSPVEIQKLKSNGYHVVKIVADEILDESGRQLIFGTTLPIYLAAIDISKGDLKQARRQFQKMLKDVKVQT